MPVDDISVKKGELIALKAAVIALLGPVALPVPKTAGPDSPHSRRDRVGCRSYYHLQRLRKPDFFNNPSAEFVIIVHISNCYL